ERSEAISGSLPGLRDHAAALVDPVDALAVDGDATRVVLALRECDRLRAVEVGAPDRSGVRTGVSLDRPVDVRAVGGDAGRVREARGDRGAGGSRAVELTGRDVR